MCLAGAWSGSLGAHTPLESAALALNSSTRTVRRRTMSWLRFRAGVGLGPGLGLGVGVSGRGWGWGWG